MWTRAYVVVSSMALVVLSMAAFRQASKPQNLGEITAHRDPPAPPTPDVRIA